MATALVTTIRCCARCQDNHENLVFHKLLRPSDEWTHWAECPNTREPIMLLIKED